MESLRLDCEDDADLHERIGLVQSALEHAMSKVRELSAELNPSAVERSGLQFALERLVARTGKTIRLQFDSSVRLPREAAKAFYRVADYAVQNAVGAGPRKRIDIQVKHSRNMVVLEVHHDGDTQVPSSGHADRVELLMLHHYAARVGIPVSIESAPGKGTTVRANYAGG